MMEREIKPGSKWRNVHGDVAVKETDHLGNVIHYPYADKTMFACVSEVYFRATHEWVSDPVEAPKVGSWWRLKGDSVRKCGVPMRVMKITSPQPDSFVVLHAFGDYTEANTKHFTRDFEPCDPPPLVKALEAWAELFQRPNPSLLAAETNELLREYRKLFPKGDDK